MKASLRFVGAVLIYLTYFRDCGQCTRAFSVVASKRKEPQHHQAMMIRCQDAADQVSRPGHVVEGEVQCPDLDSATTLLQGQRFLWIYNDQANCGGFVRVLS